MTHYPDVAVSVETAIGQRRSAFYGLTFLDARSVRVRVGRQPASTAPALPPAPEVAVTIGGEGATYGTTAMRVEVLHDPLRFRLGGPDGDLAVEVAVLDTSPSSHFGERTTDVYEIRMFPADRNARIYGCGERFDQVNQAGKVVFNDSTDLLTSKYDFTYAPVPWFMSSDGYGFLHNSRRATLFDFRSGRTGRYEIRHYAPFEAPEIEFTLFFGPALSDILQAYVQATGRPRLMPEWAFEPLMGPAYPRPLDRKLLTEYMDRLETLELPHRTFYFDGYWETYVGDLVSRDHPDLSQLIDEIHARGYRAVFWTAPYMSAAAESAPEGEERGFFLQRMPGVGAEPDRPRTAGGSYTGWWGLYIDFTNSEAVAWHQARLRAVLEAGADGFFADFGETQDIRTATFADGGDGESAGRYYTIPYHQAVADVCREVRGEDFYLTARSGWTGLQQHAGLITGDQGTSYEFIPVVLAALQSGGLSGFPFMSHCLGGYWGDHAKGPFLRWVQFGVFGSLFSIWNQGTNTEPWSFDDDEVLVVYRKYARLRMALMPHIYSYAHRASVTGLPMMQALGFAFPDDAAAAEWEDQYLFGEEFLVAPVYTEDNRREVYLPAGHRWYDYWTGASYTGGQVIDVPAPLDVLPVFVREGSVVATATSGGSDPAGALRLTFYPGEGHRLRVHHADRRWNASSVRSGARLEISVESAALDPVVVEVLGQRRPREVTLGGHALREVRHLDQHQDQPAWSFDDDGRRVTVFCRASDGPLHITSIGD